MSALPANAQSRAASGTGLAPPGSKVSSDWKTLLNRAQDPASYAPAGSRDVTESVVPTVIVPSVSCRAGSNCQPPIAAIASTSSDARTRMRTDRIGAPPHDSTRPTTPTGHAVAPIT